MPEIAFRPAPTIKQFMLGREDYFVRGLLGPVGSGKSAACCAELFTIANQQEPGPDGLRRVRIAIIRNTYRELTDTTLKTWHDWIPNTVGRWVAGDMTHIIESGDRRFEFMFRALDRPDDVRKLLSLELTYAWVNEAREVPRQVIDMLQSRVGRYPSKRDGGPTRFGIIMDTNPPDTDHWWYRLFEEDQPEGWRLYHQPSGESDEAENVENLPAEYYHRLRQGHDQAWIEVYVHGRYGFVRDGKPVYPEYQDEIHCLEAPRLEQEPLVVGIDFGRTPAATLLQRDPVDGQWRAIDELVTFDMGAINFGKELAGKLRREFKGFPVEFWGDPSGDTMTQVDDRTPFDALAAAGVSANPAPSQDPMVRHESLGQLLTKLTHLGRPGFVVDPKCRQLRKGLAGGYKYRRLQVGGEERYVDKPDKNQYSHVVESCEYGLVGAGEDRAAFETPHHMQRKPRVRTAIGSQR